MLRFSRTFTTSTINRTRYGFIGLGQMGQHMAKHIYNNLEPTDRLYVYDTNDKAANTFVDSVTSTKADTNHQLKALKLIPEFITDVEPQLDFIITMVPEGKHVKGVISDLVETYKLTNPPRLELGKGITFIDSSTIDIPTSVDVHRYVRSELPHFDFIDAPVSGGTAGARRATLSFMLSRANQEAVSEPLRKLLGYMGKNIFPCGSKHGVGLAAKLSNNYLLAVTNLAVADSFQLANSFGLDLKEYAKLVSVLTGKSWASVDNCPIPGVYPKEMKLPADDNYEGGFVTKLTRKDLVLATECAKANNRFLYLGDIGRHWYDRACDRPQYANRDLGVLYEWLGHLEVDGEGNLVEK